MEPTSVTVSDTGLIEEKRLPTQLHYGEIENFFEEARAELNLYLEPFPKTLKVFLVSKALNFRSQVEKVDLKDLLNRKAEVADDKVLNQTREHISTSLAQLFSEIGYYLDLLEDLENIDEVTDVTDESNGKYSEDSQTTSKSVDQSYLFRLISNYLTTYFYKAFAQLTRNEVKGFPIEDIMENYKWITPKDLDVNLNEEDENVRICMYTAIRALSSMDLVTSPYDKIDCISEFFNSVYIALAKSTRAAFGQTNSSTISADDLLPAVVYVILKSRALNIPFHLKYMESWIGDQRILELGQRGYEFTTIYSALDVIRNLTIEPPEPVPVDAKYFLASVEIIHREVSAVWRSKVEEIVQILKRAHTENTKLLAKQISDAKERKAWNVIKWIPGLNFTYGGIRGIYYKTQGNNKEAMNSLIGSCGGVLGLGAGIAGAMVGGPLLVPILVSIVSGSATNQVVTGGGEVLYEVHQNTDRFQSLSMDEQEKEIYDKIIKDISIIGMCYSTIRAPVYLIKGNKTEARHSGVNAVVNAGASAVGVAAGYAFARLATNLAGAASSAVDAADDVVKPLATEIIDLVTNVGIKVVTSTSTNTVVRIGTTSLVRSTVEAIYDPREEDNELF